MAMPVLQLPSAFHRNDDRLRQLEGQLRIGGQFGVVDLLVGLPFALRGGRLDFVGRAKRVGLEVVGFSMDDDRASATFNSCFFRVTTLAVICAPLGSTVVPSTLTGEERLATKESPL
jgi:hypothetical protein